ncbi:MAG: ABC transporter substrate-binding protein [Spirochaetes bacterium]|nr:ABC transporter substrate-binding protein [Spirochaetota bacterium]MBU0956566.1 ABC transporter substrate-binding protein [Spirochaetota bacterium]
MQRSKRFILLALAALLLTLPLAATAEKETDFGRKDTVYVTGGMWSIPTSFNPITWSVPAGLRGLTYESLLTYDALSDQLKPWLAKSAVWQADGKTLRVTLNPGTTWSDGSPLTAEDVAFTFTYGAWSNPFAGYLETANVIDDRTCDLVFSDPAYHSINLNLYIWPIIPQKIWSQIPAEEATDFEPSLEQSIGSGPYVIEGYDQDRVVYQRDDDWWGIKGLERSFPAKRVVYIKSMANNVAMAMLSQGRELDMANNYVSGLPAFTANNPALHTYYKGAPYNLPDNIVFLMPNHTKKPFNDTAFRRALAFAINTDDIVEIAYENMIVKPENSLGLLPHPGWAAYNNDDIAKNLGYSFNQDEASRLLDAAGYRDTDGDGLREYPDGSALSFKVSVPYGWTDWMDALRIITDNFREVGLDARPDFPDEGRYQNEMVKGEFDMLLNNWGAYRSSSPFSLYQFLFSTYTPVGEDEWTGNFGRYDNETLRNLVQEFNRIPMDKTQESNAIVRQIQTVHMQDMPYIPLWINGMWFVANTNTWTNWPGEVGSTNQNYPSLWTDKLQIGGLWMLSEIKLK